MSNHQGWAFGSTLLLFVLCEGCREVPDDLIVPRVRVGSVMPDSTGESLRAVLGAQAVTELLPGDDLNEEQYVTKLYETDPSRKLIVGWEDKSASRLRYVKVCASALNTPCAWHTEGGVRMGLTLQELERRNGRPFSVGSWQTDFDPGAVKSWNAGILAKQLDGVYLSLCLPEADYSETYSIDPLPIPSNHPVLQRLNPVVCEMVVTFDKP